MIRQGSKRGPSPLEPRAEAVHAADVKAGDHLTLQPGVLTLEGESVSRLATYEVRCRGVFPGETAEVRVEAVSRHHPRAFAVLREIVQPHPKRRAAPCPHHESRGGGCGGCALMELDEVTQRALKAAMLRERFGLQVSEVERASAELGYRHSAKRVALSLEGRLVLGSFSRGSHQPVAMSSCLTDHPRLSRAFWAVEQAANALGIEAYDEARDHGELRAVWAKTDGQRAIVTLVLRTQGGRAQHELPQAIAGVDGVLCSTLDGPTNNLRGAPASLCRGERELGLNLLGERVAVGALGFLQPNPEAAEAAYTALLAPSEEGARELAFDLYAGAGVTTKALRRQYHVVRACESHPESAAALGFAACTAEAFLVDELASGARPDLVVANPPRKGLSEEVTQTLRELQPRELRIMSCGPEGLARNLAQLTSGESGFVLQSLRAFDTLPQTPHVELVARLRRRS